MLSRARGFGSGIACTLQQRDAQRSLQRSDKAAAKATTKLASAKQQESPLAASQQQQTMLWVVAEQKERSGQAAAAAAAATLGFAAVAADVFLDQSPHLLSSLDAAAHSWVSSLVGSMPVVQHLLAGKLVSDAAIVMGLAGWAAVAVAALRAPQPRLLGTLAASGAAYVLGGGSIRHGDTLLVAALKEGFGRERPSPLLHHTLSFPSGHTTAGTFIVGTLLFVLLPAALHAAEQQRQQRDAKEPPGPAASAAQRCSAWLMAHRWPLWGAAAATTAAGRVLSDAHWCSDVLAGALLGAAVTAATAAVCESGPDAGRMLLSLLDAGRGGASAQSQPRERRDED